MIAAIDGPAGSGKSTIARMAAKAVDFGYLDSGMLYRGISKAVLDAGGDPEDRPSVVEIAARCRFQISDGQLLLNGEPLKGIHTERIDYWSAIHSRIVEVRRIVNSHIREIVDDRDFIVIGRDICTVVFPDARVKIYLDASLEARTDRRLSQSREENNDKSNPGRIRRQIEQRDAIDRGKPFGKLERTADALYIDTSDLTIDKVCDRVVQEIRKYTNIR